jgi:hypothetical protein
MRSLAALALTLVLLALVAPVASEAQVQTRLPAVNKCAITVGSFVTSLTHGEVGWVTDGRSTANFDSCPIPGGFFGPGSDPLGDQDISLTGVALSGQTGAIDTLIEVDGINCLSEGQTKSMGTRIRGLHAEGDAVVTYNGGMSPETWHLDVHSSTNQSSGSISVTLEDAFGGVFSSSLPVIGRLVFTNFSTGEVRVLEDPSCEINFGSPSTAWSLAAADKFDPGAQGLPPLPAGVSIDGDGDGAPDYITSGRTNFIPGVEYTGSSDGFAALSSEGLEAGTTADTTTIGSWKWWLFRELLLLFKHFVWIKPINPRIDVVDVEPVGTANVETTIQN